MPQYSTREYMNRAAISRTVSQSVGVEAKLTGLASGLIPPEEYMPSNEGQYRQFRRFLHDVFCLSLIDIGLFEGYELKISDLGLSSESKKIRMLKPDLYKVMGDSLHIAELSVTYNVESSRNKKYEAYSDLIQFYQESSYNVTFSVILVDLTDPEWDLSFPDISPLFREIIADLLLSLRIIHTNKRFSSIRMEEVGRYNVERMQFKVEDETLTKLVEEATGINYPPHKIISRISGESGITDKEYIDSLAMSIINDKPHQRPIPRPKSVTPHSLITQFNIIKASKPTTYKNPRILQLGCPSQISMLRMKFDDFTSWLRRIPNTGGYLTYIKSSLQNESLLEDHLITLPISQQQLEQEQLSGPGRKNYLKRSGLKLKRDPPTHIGVSPNHIKDLESLINELTNNVRNKSLRELDVPDIEETGLTAGVTMMNIESDLRSSSVSGLLQFYQSISTEITLNSMRRRKTRQYALGYSGVEGVFFLVAPGPQLRTESNIEFIKIISVVPPFHNPYSSPWIQEGDHWESDWVSVDIDRLKQWQRSYDRVALSCVANAERLVRPSLSLRESMKSEIESGNYAMLALTFLENKQSTSTTNQTIRYLWMKSLGDKDFTGLMSKFPTRINSIIQSTMLQKSVESCVKICQMDLTDLVSVGRTMRDEETGHYDESTTGVVNLLPRLFTFGGPVTVSYNLNEIYWCMAYNKDRQNPTQDAMNILNKILKEEAKYDSELASRDNEGKLDYLFGRTTLKSDIQHVRSATPESHYFSMKAVRCGMRLQDTHVDNTGDNGTWLNENKMERILSKNLSEYATFKASVKEIQHHIDVRDLKEVKKIGNRTKAIELVAEIVAKEDLCTAMDVLMSFSGGNNMNFKVFIQIFKKNQVGGVREIIILYIKARVMINILEEVARLMAKSDKREILTKGRDKRLMMRGDYEEVMSSFSKGTPLKIIKESYDMSSWCQKFLPTIFLPLFEHHFSSFEGMKDLSRFILLSHTNKRMEYPRKLVEQWMKHPEIEHEEPWLQAVKVKFMRDGQPWFYNHSNMCQGILHYNSTALALFCLSLRDALFDSCLRQLNLVKSISWRTRVGSDDKGTIIGLDLTKPDSYKQYLLLGQCERAAERLFSMELSVKSASGHLMYELNSAFMANLETLSPTIKFSLAATDMIGTTSCTSFVNESYGRIRQLRENGGSSILCAFAHSFNRQHFYDIFATGLGGENDISKIFKLPRSKIPFDFGVYPIYDIDVQDFVGPEFYNYRIIKSNPTSPAVKLLYTDVSKKELDELFPNDQTPLLKKDHFGINQGLVKQLSGMRRRLDADPVKINEFFKNNPFIIVRGPENTKETLNLILAKLFTKGAAEALRRTSPAIYVGRLSAFRTAKAWTSPFQNQECYNIDTQEVETIETFTKATYSDFIKNSVIKAEEKSVDVLSLMEVLFPQRNSFDIVETFVGKFGVGRSTDKRFSQAVRTLTVNNYNYEFTSSLKSILETSFGQSHDSSLEDVSEFRSLIKMKLESLDEFTESCKQRGVRPLDMFYYMTKLHKSSQTSRIQTFGHGPSTTGLHMTILSLKRYNHMPGMVMSLDHGLEIEQLELENVMSKKLDDIKFMYNIIIMIRNNILRNYDLQESFKFKNGRSLLDECLTTIRSIRTISGFDKVTQKTLKLVASEILPVNELKDKLMSWKTLNYTYLKKQRRTLKSNGEIQWSGDLKVLVSVDDECYTINQVNNNRYLETKSVKDVSSIYRSLKDMCKVLDMEFNSFFKRRIMGVGDIYLSHSTKMLHRSEVEGAISTVLSIRVTNDFRFKKLADMNQFKIVTQHNPKTGELQIYLSEGNVRTATICHSNGNFYPVSVPRGLKIDDDLIYLGVRFSKLLSNESWFFNYRLPIMSKSDRQRFLSEDISLNEVMSLETRDIQRITEYIETREEVNEDAFTVLQDNKLHNAEIFGEAEEMDESTFADLFRKEMDKVTLPEELSKFHEGDIQSWAEEVEESQENDLTIFERADEEVSVEMVRAFGYKKPQPRRAMHTISSLQQGFLLKSRILDCYFLDQNIKNERTRQLPHMFFWLRTNKANLHEKLYESLSDHIITTLSQNTGTPRHRIKEILTRTFGQYEVPIAMLDALINEQDVDEQDVMEQILLENEDRDEYADYKSESEESELYE